MSERTNRYYTRALSSKICESKTIDKLTDAEEVFLYRLLSRTDQVGRYIGDPELLSKYLYPRSRSKTPEEIERYLQKLSSKEIDILQWYSVDGELYIEFINFEKYHNFRTDVKRVSLYPAPQQTHKNGSERTRTNPSKLERNRLGPGPGIGIGIINNISDAEASAGKPANKKSKSQDDHEENKSRKTETIQEPRNDYERVENHYREAHQELYGFVPEINYGQTRKLLKQRFKKYTPDEIIALIDQAKIDPWILKNKAFDLATILSSQVMNRLMRMTRASPHDDGWENLPEKLDPLKMPEWLAEEVTDGI